MEHQADVVIVGGGLNGPALALALAQSGITSVLVDARPMELRAEPGFDGRAYAIALATRRMLAALGIWDRVADQAAPILDIKVSDGREGDGASPLYVHFDHREIGEGPMGHMIEDRFLRKAILEAVKANPLVTSLSPHRVIHQEIATGAHLVTTDTGAVVRGALLVGCDGRESQVASRAGLSRQGWAYSQTALVCALDHTRPHHNTAHQMFLPSGPLALLPLPGDRVSVVWSEDRDTAVALHEADDSTYLAALAPKVGSFLGDLSLTGGRHAYPLDLSLASALTAARLALVGDAAHGIHPLAGQGLNLGLRDVAALAEVLSEAKQRGEDLGTAVVLDRYARWRRTDILALAATTDVINRVFSNDNPVMRGLRDLALGAAQAMPPVRRAMMREAAGLTGDLPRLMRGEGLG
ncbi:MAG: UbiH/UbiF/VisC/COQ6 family ubiquinone biosynthesis hydroxylase [Pseudomonadota bacterium]